MMTLPNKVRRQTTAWLLCFSLANLVLIRPWSEAQEEYLHEFCYYKMTPGLAGVAILLNVLLVTLLLRGLLALVKYANRPWLASAARWGFLLLLLLPLNYVRQRTGWELFAVSHLVRNPLVWLVAPVLLCVILRWHHQTLRFARALVLILSPLGIIAIGQCVFYLGATVDDCQTRASLAGKHPVPAAPQKTRVIWIILDELDQRAAFDERPPWLHLPEFDQLRRESIFLTHAYPPSGATITSLPALICGRVVTNAHPHGASSLLLDIQGETEARNWSSLSNIFTEARRSGVRSSVFGWYHPYTRVLGCDADESFWVPHPRFDRLCFDTVPLAMVAQVRGIFSDGQLVARRRYCEFYLALRDRLMESSTNSQLGLVFCHILIPHTYGIYDPARQDFTTQSRSGAEEYFGNLALCDVMLRQLRERLEVSGLGQSSILVITSDHWWRYATPFYSSIAHRIPLLIKMPGQAHGVEYKEPCNTILLYNLVLGMLRGEVKDAAQVTAYLDKHREDVPFDVWKYSVMQSQDHTGEPAD